MGNDIQICTALCDMPHMLKAGYINIACRHKIYAPLVNCTAAVYLLCIAVYQQTCFSLTVGIFFTFMWKCKTNIWGGETTAKALVNKHRNTLFSDQVTKNHHREVLRWQPTKGNHVVVSFQRSQSLFNFLTHTCTERITRAWEPCCHIKHQGILEDM